MDHYHDTRIPQEKLDQEIFEQNYTRLSKKMRLNLYLDMMNIVITNFDNDRYEKTRNSLYWLLFGPPLFNIGLWAFARKSAMHK